MASVADIKNTIKRELSKDTPDLNYLVEVVGNNAYPRPTWREVCFITEVMITLSMWTERMSDDITATFKLHRALENPL